LTIDNKYSKIFLRGALKKLKEEIIVMEETIKFLRFEEMCFKVQKISSGLLDCLDSPDKCHNPDTIEKLQMAPGIIKFLHALRDERKHVGQTAEKYIGELIEKIKPDNNIIDGQSGLLLTMVHGDEVKDLLWLYEKLHEEEKNADIDKLGGFVKQLLDKDYISDENIRWCLNFLQEISHGPQIRIKIH